MPGCRMTIVAAALSLSIAAPVVAARAQTNSDSSGRSLHFRLGGGVGLKKTDALSNGVVGADWQKPRSRFALRLDGGYFRNKDDFRPINVVLAEQSCAVAYCLASRETELVGASLDGKIDLTRSRFRPYVMSGIGLYRVLRTDEANVQCQDLSCTLTPGRYSEVRSGTGSFALHAGFGFSYRIGGTQVFTETRLLTLTNQSTAANLRAPLTLGIRF